MNKNPGLIPIITIILIFKKHFFKNMVLTTFPTCEYNEKIRNDLTNLL